MPQENFNFKASVPKKPHKLGAKKITKPQIRHVMTLQKVVEWIKSKGYEDAVSSRLIKIAAHHPHGALAHFVENIHVHIAKINKELRDLEN